MLKTSLAAAAALTLAGAASLQAQSFQQFANQLSIGARTGMESEYVYRGKEHSDVNIQTAVTAEFAVPLPRASYGLGVFGKVLSMNPVTQSANQIDTSLGAKFEYSGFKFELGWIYHTFPNQNAQHYGLPGGETNPVTNRAIYNRSNEVYFSVGTQLTSSGTFLDGLRAEGYIYYDWNLQQTTVEGDIGYTFNARTVKFLSAVPRLAITVQGFLGHSSAAAANGDQRADGVDKWKNAYAYAGGYADISYRIGDYTTLGTGIRYAWNNDGGSQDDPRLTGNTARNCWWGVWLKFSY